MTPICKVVEPADVANYRPVSILPAVSKIVEKVVAEQLVDFLNTERISFPLMPFDFREHQSTETAICFLIVQIKKKLDRGGVVGAVFLDLCRTFDTGIIISSLNCHVLIYLNKMYKGWSQADPHPHYCSAGVPQGSILGPLLLYMNDFPTICPDVMTLIYADETII